MTSCLENTIQTKCTTTIVHQVRLTSMKKYDEVRHPAPFCFFLDDCNHLSSGIVQSTMAILKYITNQNYLIYDKVRVRKNYYIVHNIKICPFATEQLHHRHATFNDRHYKRRPTTLLNTTEKCRFDQPLY